MKEKKQLYEGMYVVSAILSEDARRKALDKIKLGITERGGEVHKVHDLGRKKLAYEIRDMREGHYLLLYFTLGTSEVKELWREYGLNEDLLRYGTFVASEVLEKIEFKKLVEQG